MDTKSECTGARTIDCRGPICVVDDDELIRCSVTTLLHSMDFDAYCFAGAKEFLESELVDACVCLISDVKMKKMSGFMLYQALTSSGKKIPVIFISGHADEQMRKKAADIGAEALLDKPFNDHALLRLVEKILASRRPS
jgi:FixJ family two-component response regulator